MFTAAKIAKMAATVLVGAGATVALIATAATASAGSVDDSFLADLGAQGIEFDSASGAIDDAYQVCDLLGDGTSPYDIRDEILSNSDLRVDQAESFVVASVEHYCPEFA